MAWSRLQSASHAVLALTNPVTMGSNCSSGSTLIAAVAQSGATSDTVTSVKDGAGNSFIFLASAVLNGSAGTRGVSIWALNTPAGDVGIAPTITATLSTSTDSAILVQEVSGIVTGATLAALVDGTPGTLAGTAMGATGSPSYTSTAANEYLVAVYGDDGDGTTYTKPAALTDDLNSINSSSLNDIAIAYGNSTNGVEAGSWSLASGTAAHWGVLLLAFQITAGGAAPATYTPQRYGQPAPAWQPQQRPYTSDPSFYPASVLPATPLDTAWQAGGAYSHLYADDALRDRRQYFTQPPRVSDPNLLVPPASLDPTQNAAQDTVRRYGLPATHADRREVPAQHDLRDANTVATAANPLVPPLDSAWQAGGKYWQLYNTAAAFTDRRQVPQQKDRRDANTVGTPGAVTDPTISAAEDRQRRANLAATHADRRLVPQQRLYPDRQPDGSYATGPSYTTGAWWSSDDQGWNLQRTYPAVDLTTAELENELLGGAQTGAYYRAPATHAPRWWMPQQPFRLADPLLITTAELENELLGGAQTSRYYLATAYTDRREVPQQRAYLDLTPFAYSDVPVGAGTTEAWWGQDTSPFYPAQRAYISDPSSYPPLNPLDPLLAGQDWLDGHQHQAATHADRRLVPQQRAYISDPSFYPSGAVTDPLTLAWGAGGGYQHLYSRAADITDRRLVPQQRPYISDPLLLGTALLENELLGGAETGKYYRIPASHAARWWMPQQRAYLGADLTTAQLENELLGGADTARHAAWTRPGSWPAQRPYVSDPLLLTTAELENELLGGADTLRHWLAAAFTDRRLVPQQRLLVSDPALLTPAVPLDPTQSAWLPLWLAYNTPAVNYDRREVPQQRAYISDPSFYPSTAPTDPLTVAWGAGGVYWHLYNQAADVTDRREVPQQRQYVSGPTLLGTAELENELLGGAETGKYYRIPATHYARWWMPQQRAYVSDPSVLLSALLENELLGGGGTVMRYLLPATHADRRQAGLQRIYPAAVDIPLDPTQSAWVSLWLVYNIPATHVNRRLYPPQRLYFPVPPPPPLIVPGEAVVVLTDPRDGSSAVTEQTVTTGGVNQ